MSSKKWWQSKAIWGGITAAAATIANSLLSGHWPPTPAELMALAGALVAIYGRSVATTEIKSH